MLNVCVEKERRCELCFGTFEVGCMVTPHQYNIYNLFNILDASKNMQSLNTKSHIPTYLLLVLSNQGRHLGTRRLTMSS